jgi:hypothetical protein
MIIEDTLTGRYTFFFDINDRAPFDGRRYNRANDDPWVPVELGILTDLEIDRFAEMEFWLKERTVAYRMGRVFMTTPTTYSVSAIAVHVPGPLAPLFKLFWYG